MKLHTPILGFALFFALSPAFAAAPPSAPVKTAPKKAEKAPEKSKSTLLSDSWYTVTIAQGKKYAFYNEKAEVKEGRVVFQTRMVKLEEGFLNEESLGCFAEDTAELKPLFYNFRSVYRSTEMHIDGNITSDSLLTVRIKQGKEEQPLVKRSIPKSAFLSSMFSLWLERNLERLVKEKSVSFSALLEDNIAAGFAPVPGRATLKPADDFAKKNDALLVEVTFKDSNFLWWLDQKGKMIRMQAASPVTLIERSSQKNAESFLSPDSK